MGSGALGCGGTCMKYILFIFNFVFWLSGAAILGVAIWLKVDPNVNDYLQIINWDESDETLNAASWILIGVGAFIFVVGFLGCCGACKESSCMLSMYAGFMILVLLAEVTAGILAIVFSSQIDEGLEKGMKDQVQVHFKADSNGGKTDPITLAWKSLQIDLECCGGSGYEDYVGSVFTSNSSDPVPVSCCVLKNKDGDRNEPNVKNKAECMKDAQKASQTKSDYLHIQGCHDSLIDWMKDQSAILIGVALGLAALEIFGIVFACCVKKEIDSGGSY